MADVAGQEAASASGAETAATTSSAEAGPYSEQGAGRAAERHELCAAATSAETDEIGWHNLQFGLREQIAYHSMREQALARLNRFMTGLQVFLATSAIASISDQIPLAPVWSAISSALAGVILLVIDPSGGARDHRALRIRYHNILADSEECTKSDDDLRALKAKMQRVFADAPPAYRVVQAVAYNTAVNATYLEVLASQHRYHVGSGRRLFAHWIPMRGFPFQLEKDRTGFWARLKSHF